MDHDFQVFSCENSLSCAKLSSRFTTACPKSRVATGFSDGNKSSNTSSQQDEKEICRIREAFVRSYTT